MAVFKEAWIITGANEGGYANIPGDRGGETYMGIARNFFPHWEGWSVVDKHKPIHEGAFVHDASLDELVQKFYITNFWNPIGGDKISNQDLANQVFDMAVNAGVGTALNLLKESKQV